MKIINGLVMVLSITQILSAYDFTLDAGTQQSISSGDTIDLNGKVLTGDKSKIDHYEWEENGEVLKNTSGDEIIYEDDANAENGYAPEGKGTHILKFVVVDESGERHEKRLVVEVDKKENVRIDSIKDITFDIRPEFPLKHERYTLLMGNHHRTRDVYYLEVHVGDIVPLSGIVDASKKSLVDYYTWESAWEFGTILKNQLNDEIQYWDEENRENDYVPQKVGNDVIYFVVTDINGHKTKKALLLKVRGQEGTDDHGDDMASATKIDFNKLIIGTTEREDDHDFFKFKIDKRQYVRIMYNQHRPSKVNVLSSDGEKIDLDYVSPAAPEGESYSMVQTVFEPGTYYIDIGKHIVGEYRLKIITDDIITEDIYGNNKSEATELTLGSRIVGYINNQKDVDVFYFVAPKTGRLTLKNLVERTDDLITLALDEEDYGNKEHPRDVIKSFDVEKGQKYYFSLIHSHSRGSRRIIQCKYILDLSLE